MPINTLPTGVLTKNEINTILSRVYSVGGANPPKNTSGETTKVRTEPFDSAKKLRMYQKVKL